MFYIIKTIIDPKNVGMSFKSQTEKKVFLKEKQELNIVDMFEISHISCEGYLCTVYTINNKNYKVARLLKHFESDLLQYGFVRVNHNTIVNLSHVNKVISNCKSKKIVVNEVEINVSRRKVCVLLDYLKKAGN